MPAPILKVEAGAFGSRFVDVASVDKEMVMMRACCLFLVLSCAGLTGGCVFPWFSAEVESPAGPEQAEQTPLRVSPRARELFEQARALWNEDDVCLQPDAAAAWLDAALEVDPDYAEALLWRGRALADGGYLEDAFDDLTRSIRLQATALAYAARGLTGLRLGNVQGAERDVETAIQLDGREPHAYVYRAALHFVREESDQACADLAAACERGLCVPHRKAVTEGLCR